MTASLLAGCSPDAVELPPVDATGADEQACRDLLDALPDTVADQERRDVTPEDALGAAWGDPAIVLTCNVPAPQDFGPTSSCLTVKGVDWFLPQDKIAPPGEEQGTVTIWSIDRDPGLTLELPGDYWPPATALADLADAVRTVEATGRCR